MQTVIMTGGASRRMGRDKAMLVIGGKTMLQLLIDRYGREFGRPIVSVNKAGRFSFEGADEVPDAFPDQGPLNGIIAGFSQREKDTVFITATDIPFGSAGLVKKLGEMCEGYDACAIKHGVKGIEPMFAIYKRQCAQVALELLGENRKSVMGLLERVNTRFVSPEEIPEFDLDRILMNVNTPEEYEKVLNDLTE